MAYTQADRPMRVHTPLGEDVMLLESFRGTEGISQLFQFHIKMLSEKRSVDFDALLSKPVVLTVRLADDSERHFHGLVNRCSQLDEGEDEMVAYEVEVVPWLWFLSLFTDCRIFQNLTVLEIIEQVFKDRGFTEFRADLQGSYSPREYCVQYRESDLNFVSRLMEDEGMFYFFEHTEEKHTLVLADNNSSIKECPHQPKARFSTTAGTTEEDDLVHSLYREQQVYSGTASLTDYNFEKPSVSLRASVPGEQKGERFDYPGKYGSKSDGDRYARVRLEEEEVKKLTVIGSGVCRAFIAGYKFELEEHYREDANIPYTLLTVEHSARNPSYRSGENAEGFEYKNRFRSMPHSAPFRPTRLSRKPVIHGSQTAVVVGKSGEEIYVDKYGRIKVQFFWDRYGKKDENSSCWIRVAHMWAGKNWGSMYIPRLGQEVIVDFLEGDADQPIITGRVYNADQMPPYPLPDKQNLTGVKSLSTKGGGGYNEFTLDDTKGSEKISMHGEKDIEIRVENDRKEWIGRDRHLMAVRDKLEDVGRDNHVNHVRDRIEKIGRDHHLEIKGKEAIKITGVHSMTVQGDVVEEFKSNHSEQVTSDYYLKGMNVVLEASTGLTIKVGGNFITINSSGIQIKGTMVLINSGGSALSGSAGSSVSPLTPTAPLDVAKGEAGSMSATGPEAGQLSSTQMTLISPKAKGTRQSAASNAPTHNAEAEENKEKKSWIEIKLLDEEGNPVPGEAYKITLPDGSTVADGTLDDKGFARVDNIDPGNCKVTFPNLDEEAWEPKA
ncbi:MAG: type VI secretion system tip protein VgrG [Bryobacteraceae bacterium]|nr:type VI secretion system tip protein VgrG [Bryobacteraceae bacterium]